MGHIEQYDAADLFDVDIYDAYGSFRSATQVANSAPRGYRDSDGYSGGYNRYAYAGNNPVTGSDPSGLDFIIGPANAPWLDFTGSGTVKGLKTGCAATAKALTWGRYSGGTYQNKI